MLWGETNLNEKRTLTQKHTVNNKDFLKCLEKPFFRACCYGLVF